MARRRLRRFERTAWSGATGRGAGGGGFDGAIRDGWEGDALTKKEGWAAEVYVRRGQRAEGRGAVAIELAKGPKTADRCAEAGRTGDLSSDAATSMDSFSSRCSSIETALSHVTLP